MPRSRLRPGLGGAQLDAVGQRRIPVAVFYQPGYFPYDFLDAMPARVEHDRVIGRL